MTGTFLNGKKHGICKSRQIKLIEDCVGWYNDSEGHRSDGEYHNEKDLHGKETFI